MSDFSIHEIRDSGHLRYEIRRELTQDELRAIFKYASEQQILFADALQAYLDEVQRLVDAEVKKRLENDILFGVADLKEEKKEPCYVPAKLRPFGIPCPPKMRESFDKGVKEAENTNDQT